MYFHRSQGVDTMEQRVVSGTIPLSEIPFVMRALGFYPTEQQVSPFIQNKVFHISEKNCFFCLYFEQCTYWISI